MNPSPHPIGSEALDCLVRGSDEAYALSDAGAERLGALLRAEVGKPQLLDAVLELVNLAYFLENQKGSPGAARALLDLAESVAEELRALGQQGEAAADTVRRASKGLDKLTGRTESQGPKPPGPGDPSVGGVKLRRR